MSEEPEEMESYPEVLSAAVERLRSEAARMDARRADEAAPRWQVTFRGSYATAWHETVAEGDSLFECLRQVAEHCWIVWKVRGPLARRRKRRELEAADTHGA